MVTKEEQKLIDGCIQGKTESQKQLFLEYGPLVKGICQRYAASPEEGEDMFHDVFVFILTHFKDYNKITSLKGWIYRIAINKAVDHYRKSRAAKFTPIENEEFVVSALQTPIPEVLTMTSWWRSSTNCPTGSGPPSTCLRLTATRRRRLEK